MRVLLVDDHLLFIEGLRMYLKHLDPAAECTLATSAEEGLQIAQGRAFDLVLLDWNLKGLSREGAVIRFRECLPDCRIIIVSGEPTAKAVRDAIGAGALGFIPKDQRGEALEQALRTVAVGGIFLPAPLLSAAGGDSAGDGSRDRDLGDIFPELTARQVDVFRVMLRGLTNKQIARQLGISDQTVKKHVDVIFREVGVANRTEAVYLAARQGARIV